MTTGFAPWACNSAYVPRAADPALMTSSTIAIRSPRTRGANAGGRRYTAGYNPSDTASITRSVNANSTSSTAAMA